MSGTFFSSKKIRGLSLSVGGYLTGSFVICVRIYDGQLSCHQGSSSELTSVPLTAMRIFSHGIYTKCNSPAWERPLVSRVRTVPVIHSLSHGLRPNAVESSVREFCVVSCTGSRSLSLFFPIFSRDLRVIRAQCTGFTCQPFSHSPDLEIFPFRFRTSIYQMFHFLVRNRTGNCKWRVWASTFNQVMNNPPSHVARSLDFFLSSNVFILCRHVSLQRACVLPQVQHTRLLTLHFSVSHDFGHPLPVSAKLSKCV